jgi:outer membrane protein assembly factor BamB
MDYRDEGDALRQRIENLEDNLAAANEQLSQQGDAKDRAARLARLELRFESASRLLEELRVELATLRRAESEPVQGESSVASPERAAPVQGTSRPARMRVLFVSAMVGTGALGAAFLFFRTHAAPSPPPVVAVAPRAPPADAPKAEASFTAGILYPMLARDSAGAEVDLIVWGRSEGKSCLLRIDGHTGRRAWMTCPYGPPNGGPWVDDLNHSALVADTVLVALARSLDAFDARTGEKRWSTRLDEGVVAFCRAPDGAVYVTEDRGAGDYTLGLPSGELKRAARPSACAAVQTNKGSPWVTWREDVPRSAGAIQVDGMVPTSRIEHAGRVIVLGYGRPGPHVPFAASVDARGAVIWKRALAADAGASDTDAARLAVLDDHHLCAVYPAAGFQLHLGCWDPATGDTAWDLVAEPLPKEILIAGAYLVVRADRGRDGKGWAFHDLASGVLRLSL